MKPSARAKLLKSSQETISTVLSMLAAIASAAMLSFTVVDFVFGNAASVVYYAVAFLAGLCASLFVLWSMKSATRLVVSIALLSALAYLVVSTDCSDPDAYEFVCEMKDLV